MPRIYPLLLLLLLLVAALQFAGATAEASPAAPAPANPPGASGTTPAAPAPPRTAIPAAPTASDACTALSAQEAVSAIARVAHGSLPKQEQRARIASRLAHLPNSGAVDVLLFRPFDPAEAINYRVIVMDTKSTDALFRADPANPVLVTPTVAQVMPIGRVSAELATNGPGGTDFLWKETPVPKTLIRFYPEIDSLTLFRKSVTVYVLGCKRTDDGTPAVVGSFDTRLSSRAASSSCALFLCVLFYLAAVLATYYIRKSARKAKAANGPKDLVPPPNQGTNYATVWRHFDPVVLTAGPNGRGSPAKLQILFFSLVVLGLVFYIWMLTGQLTGLSTTVLLLMGISGIGATAAAGAEVTKNRLDFDNWAWLINHGWLPKGGIAEVNLARWKDIFATDGEFDVTRFQMVTFSVMVGLALLSAGAQLTDLSTFEIPEGLLGILGLSQVVYVAGKLVAPPSISDLNKKVTDLRAAEASLQDNVEKSNAHLLANTVVLLSESDDIKAAKAAYRTYLESWGTTRTMFESTLGQLLPKAWNLRPPFRVPRIVGGAAALQPGTVGGAYGVTLTAMGGQEPYVWTQAGGSLPPGITLIGTGQLIGAPTLAGQYTVVVQVVDKANATASGQFTILVT
ncbi:Ig domain-containing protein [Cupriavidus basilensis]|uniref:Ig domain-containing protein n=1 Tax=Cupriavidus basilensis TaxID=68895 RepID=A0ABT6B3B9_9BURK|nr:Ig domain-containing protein [Cupriavidus basilensis]MDF3838466.1 Ig domain-containing protein [Cupriavidus basilensis]